MSASDLLAHHKRLMQWLRDDALPVWWEIGADRLRGGFHEAIDLSGKPVLGNRRARVQARQIFSYAVAGELGWTGPWLQAVDHGLGYFLDCYRRADGMFWNAIDAGGKPTGAEPYLYEQAFALLALATARRPGSEAIANTLFDRLMTERRGSAGGFTGFVEPNVYQTDPHMHLLEASLAWEAVSRDPRWSKLADEVVDLCLSRFISRQHGMLLEYFEPSWTPVPGQQGRLVWPGHQLEWAGLLERWGISRGRPDVRAIARTLYRSGVDYGIDRRRGVMIYEHRDDYTVTDSKGRFWSQTEWLKAGIILARTETSPSMKQRYLADAVDAATALQRYLEVPVRGLWRDRLLADGTWVDEPAPASSFYHAIDALRVLDQFVGDTRN
jgi:mannose/cellobiose epimerase-like protein (N-acyl-D-glucosamine 2-epimerase family)